MKSSRKSLLWAGLLASATFACSGAFAQAPLTAPTTAPAADARPATPAAAAPGAERRHAERKHVDPAQRMERMQQRRAQHLAQLKDKLKLAPAQESAWNSFTAALQPPPRPAAGQPSVDRAEFAKLTTPQRLDRMQARQAERNAAMNKRADATRSLYAALSPEQQKTFDAEAMPRFGPGGHGGPGHRGGPGGHHHPRPPAAKS
ncbi:Spy/CpxP family protein refolding chaperone [Variovorax sp. J22P168]|uniref:Spy/CpxP family protein refolding chaperone n=1 Tax=Variovorax jilinensis TaxID=3053513 RepID=UPI002578FC4A|nr:Spy/CpxP family protein refolding chaperone [Variovorax sp. J22P168]MDM0014242.1 Spy/CpxP family protein refolding chaperone [Variovorax sp. J22P168]